MRVSDVSHYTIPDCYSCWSSGWEEKLEYGGFRAWSRVWAVGVEREAVERIHMLLEMGDWGGQSEVGCCC